MKKVYNSIVVAAVMATMLTGLWGKPVYAAEEIMDDAAVTDEIIEGEEAADNAEDGAEGLPDDAALYGPESLYGNVQSADGTKTILGGIPDDVVPVSFNKTTIDYQGQTVEAVLSSDGSITLVYVTDNTGSNYYMKLDTATGNLENFRMIKGPGDRFVMVLNPDETVVPPAGFEKASLDWDGQALIAYVNTNIVSEEAQTQTSDYFLIYGMSDTGFKGFYLYDQNEGTYQRYLDLNGSKGTGSSGKLIDFAAAGDGDSAALVRIIVLGVMTLIIILLIVAVVILAIKLKEYAEYEYIDEEDYNAQAGIAQGAYQMQGSFNTSSQSGRGYEDESYNEDSDEQDDDGEDLPDEQDRNGSSGRSRTTTKKTAHRHDIMETGEIADLDDILNDPDSTSNLPTQEDIMKAQQEAKEKAARARKEAEAKKAEAKKAAEAKSSGSKDSHFEDMQVSVDSFSPGMPAMVDTDMIAEDIGEVDEAGRGASGRITGEMEFAMDGYSDDPRYQKKNKKQRDDYNDQQDSYGDDGYGNDGYYNDGGDGYYGDDYYGDDDYYGLTREQKKERKALEKQRRKAQKEAEKDAKYMEKERLRAEKRKKYGYEEPQAMDWSTFSDSMQQDDDDRRPVGNNADNMPSYMSKEAVRNGSYTSRDEDDEMRESSSKSQPKSQSQNKAQSQPKSQAPMTEEDRAEAVIRAARGNNYSEEDEKEKAKQAKKEQDYQTYRQGARNQYEEFKREDEDEARRRAAIESRGRGQVPGMPSNGQKPGAPANGQIPGMPMQSQPQAKNPEFTQDLDEDFEFEFLNIRHPS